MVSPPPAHRWYTPDDCAALLLAVKHGNGYRAPCPVHRGDSTTALHIFLGTDKYGHPKTVLYCHAHQCPRAAICAEMGIEVKNLYSVQPAYAKATQSAPRAHSPRLDRLKTMEEPSPDDIAQILLEEMMVSDPVFLDECPPARETLWRLMQEHQRQPALTKALRQAGYSVRDTLRGLREEFPHVPEHAADDHPPVQIQGRASSPLTLGEGRDEA